MLRYDSGMASGATMCGACRVVVRPDSNFCHVCGIRVSKRYLIVRVLRVVWALAAGAAATWAILFPVWQISYDNAAGEDEWMLKRESVTRSVAGDAIQNVIHTEKRQFLFGGVREIGNWIPRDPPVASEFFRDYYGEQLKIEPDGTRRLRLPWQLPSGHRGSPDVRQMLVDILAISVVSLIWGWLLRRSATAMRLW